MLRSILIISLAVLQLTVAQCTTPAVCNSIIKYSDLDDSIIKESGVYPAVQVNTVGFNPAFTTFSGSSALIISDEAQISGTVANQKRYFSKVIELNCMPKYAFVYCKSSSPALTKLYINGILVPSLAPLCVDKNSPKPTFSGTTPRPQIRLTKHFLVGKNIIEWEVSNSGIENKLTNPIGLMYEISFSSSGLGP
jgi:hypothetical protein